jgi:hypothetical protein
MGYPIIQAGAGQKKTKGKIGNRILDIREKFPKLLNLPPAVGRGIRMTGVKSRSWKEMR